MGEVEGRGMGGWGIGVVSMGVYALEGWRFSMVFSRLSSFCSTTDDSSFSLTGTISSFSSLRSFLAFKMFLLMALKFTSTLSK